MKLLTSLTPAQIKVSLFFAAFLWLYAAIDDNIYLMILLPWGAYLFLTSWKRANPGIAIFEEKEEPAKAEEAAPAAAPAEEPTKAE